MPNKEKPTPDPKKPPTIHDKPQDYYFKILEGALKNSFKFNYSESLTTTVPNWLALKAPNTKGLVDKAIRNLNEFLDVEYRNDRGKISSKLLKIKFEVSKYINDTYGEPAQRKEETPSSVSITNINVSDAQKQLIDNTLDFLMNDDGTYEQQQSTTEEGGKK